MSNSDQLTILRAVGSMLLTKQFVLTDEGLEKRRGSNARLFTVETPPVTNLDELSAILSGIQFNPKLMVIRGALKCANGTQPVLRRCVGNDAHFEARARRWACFDIDDLPLPPELADFNAHTDELIALACADLPPEFSEVDCHWQFSSSMGVTRGLIKLHLWFWLSEPVSDQHLKAWCAGFPIDPALFNPVQPHYTAAPIFEPRDADPVELRSGIFRAGSSTAMVLVPTDLNDRIARRAVKRGSPRAVFEGTIDPQEVIRNEAGLVINGRERFLWRKSIEAMAELSKGKRTPSIEELTTLTWERFSAEADLSDRRWVIANAREKAEARLRELEGGLTFNARSQSHVLVPDVDPHFGVASVSLEAAVGLMDSALTDFFDKAVVGHQAKMVLRITMGTGKTQATVAHLLKAFEKQSGLSVAIYTRRHDLANELETKLAPLGDSVDLVHVRGRNALGPDDNPMCQRSIYVKSLADQGTSVRPNACFRDEEHKCEFYHQCPYWKQFAPPNRPVLGSVRIYPHDYLPLPREDGEPQPDIVIIDEGFVDKLHETFQLPLEEVRRGFFMEGSSLIGNQVADAIRDGELVLPILRREGVSAGWFQHRERDDVVNAVPFQSSSNQPISPSTASTHHYDRAKVALAEVLLEELAIEGRDKVTRVRYNPQPPSVVIDRIRPLRIPTDASILILDATADELLLSKLLGPVDFRRIDVDQNAYVTQVYDRTGSNTSWDNNEDSFEDLLHVLSERAKAGERVLCVSHKALDDRLRAITLPDGVSSDHFGNLRGSNDYEDFDTIVITGRNQPPQSFVDGLARAIFWNDSSQLQHDDAANLDAPASTDLPIELRGYLTTDPDMRFGVRVRSFSDPRVEAVHAQLREAETVQAIARLRLVRARAPKQVFLLGNLPIELPVDRLAPWDQLMPDWAEQELLTRGSVPLTPKGLLKMRPDIFTSESLAKDRVRRSHLHDPATLLLASPTFRRLQQMIVSFQQVVNGKPFGREQSHLFVLAGDSEGATGNVHEWKNILEAGYGGVPGSGWGPIVIKNVDWVTPTNVPLSVNGAEQDWNATMGKPRILSAP